MSGIVLGTADATINKTQSLSSNRSNFIGRSGQVSIQLKYCAGSATAGVAQDALRAHESSAPREGGISVACLLPIHVLPTEVEMQII